MPRDIFHITSAGSVDDGKSTILARLLFDTGSVFDDQLGGIDPSTVDATTIADLLDGLDSEREQGITIDVAHRFFDSDTRRYHIADSPGHEQYTRNMVTAASHADALLLVLEAHSGVKPQTLNHLRIAKILGITAVIVAVNKMDLVRHSQKTFLTRAAEITSHLDALGFRSVQVIPVSGLSGVNIVKRGRQMRWWAGPTLLEALDSLELAHLGDGDALCVIQDVRRVDGGGRRYLASLVSGRLRKQTALHKAGTNVSVALTRIGLGGSYGQEAEAPREVMLELDGDIDLQRGDILSHEAVIEVTGHFTARLVWLDATEGHSGRRFDLRLAHSTTRGSISRAWGLDSDLRTKTGEIGALQENSVSLVNIELSNPIAFAPFGEIPELGRFILVDSYTGATLAAGTILYALRRSENVVPHDFTLSTSDFESVTGVRGQVAWFTGLSGSGKSTIANAVSLALHSQGTPHVILDGDTLRTGLSKDLGFSETERIENIRRAAEVAKLMADSGLIVLVSLISPYRADRANAEDIIGPERFAEIFVDTPLEVCEARDPKGLYKKARDGSLPQFTGVSSPYEEPQDPDVRLDGTGNVQEATLQVLAKLIK